MVGEGASLHPAWPCIPASSMKGPHCAETGTRYPATSTSISRNSTRILGRSTLRSSSRAQPPQNPALARETLARLRELARAGTSGGPSSWTPAFSATAGSELDPSGAGGQQVASSSSSSRQEGEVAEGGGGGGEDGVITAAPEIS